MSILSLVATLALTRVSWAAPAGTVPEPTAPATPVVGTGAADTNGPSAEDIARFAALKSRWLQQQGVPASLAGGTVPAPPPPAPGTPPKPEPTWEQAEAERRKAFDEQFGGGSYDGFVSFERRCSPPACNKLATGEVFIGANKFVDLQNDVTARRVVPMSPDFRARTGEIKTGLRGALNDMSPKPGEDPKMQAELIRVSDPIVKRVFSPQELLQFAQRNADAAQSAPYYAFLGKTLNGTGAPREAKAAFDQALAVDPGFQPALSGRAEAEYRLSDFPSAVRDARAALELQPSDANAMTTLRFSEQRVAGGPAVALSEAPERAPGGDDGALPAREALPATAASAAAQAAQDARRSGDLLNDARRRLRVGDLAGAAALLGRATEVDPSNASARSLSAIVHIRLKDYRAALADAEAGLRLKPDSGALNDTKAFALNHLKDYAAARDAADRALKANPRDAVAYFNRAAALRGLGDMDGSMADLERAAELDPKFRPVLNEARRLPTDADLVYLFPGEAAGLEPEEAPAPPAALPPWVLLAGGAAAGLAVAFLALLLFRRAPPPAPPPLAARWVPPRLAGKYEVGREIGSGGMGVVYEGFDSSLGRPVAIKRLRPELRLDPRESARFLTEAKMVARLKHPNIVEVYGVVDEGGDLFLVFERVDGVTLHDFLSREKRLPFGRARDLFRGVCAALEEAHRKAVVHRDLKPANIMLETSGRCRVMDFGIARLAEDAVSRVTRTVAGTPLYMAPEQEQGVSRRESDLFAAGVCLYETLAGRRPFAGAGPSLLVDKMKKAYEPASRFMDKAPGGLDDFFARALEPDPDKRYPSAAEFLRALESLDA